MSWRENDGKKTRRDKDPKNLLKIRDTRFIDDLQNVFVKTIDLVLDQKKSSPRTPTDSARTKRVGLGTKY